MNSNANALKAETCGKLAARLADLKAEITKCSNLLALVAPVDLNKQKAEIAVTSVNPEAKQEPQQ